VRVLPRGAEFPFVNNATCSTVALSARHRAPACLGDSHRRNLIITISTCSQKNNWPEQAALQCECVHNPPRGECN